MVISLLSAILFQVTNNNPCPVGWDCRIHQLFLCKGVRPYPWLRVVAPERALSMGQIEQNCELMLNWIVWIRAVFDIETVYLC